MKRHNFYRALLLIAFCGMAFVGCEKDDVVGERDGMDDVPRVSSLQEPPSNQIFYTATSKLDNISFFASATQHLYDPETGRGCVTFSSPVTSIPNYAFEKNQAINSITLPSTVTTIGEAAFDWCLHLFGATLPGVQTIGEIAFCSCPLTAIDLPKVQTIGDNAFLLCNLTKITLGPDISVLGAGAFVGNKYLDKVNCYNSESRPQTSGNPFEGSYRIGLYVPFGCRALYGPWLEEGWVGEIRADLDPNNY